MFLEVACVELAEQAQVFAAGPAPQSQSEILSLIEQAKGIVDRVVCLGHSGHAAAHLGRRFNVLPEFATGVERVKDHLDVTAERCQHAMVGRCRVGDAEQVQPRPQPFGRKLALCLGARQQLVDAQPDHALGLRAAGNAAGRAKDRQPERALPGFRGREQAIAVESGACLPPLDHRGSRRRIFLEKRAQPKGELAAPAVNRVPRPAAREKVFAHGCHRCLFQKAVVVKQHQQVALDLLRIHHAAIGYRLLSHVGQQPAQERDLQIGRNPARPRHAQAQIGLHIAIGHHHPHRRKGTFALPLLLQVAHEGRQERLGAVGVANANHGAARITRGRKTVCRSEDAILPRYLCPAPGDGADHAVTTGRDHGPGRASRIGSHSR
jgi:hypothetical protein